MTDAQLRALRQLARSLDYGSGPEHSKQVKRLSLNIYLELVRLNLLADSKNDRKILTASALLHNVGLPRKRHNQAAFDLLEAEIPRVMGKDALSAVDLASILYCILWHRGSKFDKRGNIEILRPGHVRKLAAIIRIADALDRSFQQLVDDVIIRKDGNSLEFVVISNYAVDAERERAAEKADLFRQAFHLKYVGFTYPGATS